MTSWLHIIGIGEDGMAGLSSAAQAVLEAAEVIVGGDRHHRLSDRVTAKRLSWPSPFDALIDELTALKGRRVAVLATGDPLWYSVGARITKAIPAEEIVFHPQISAFQYAACRMGWSIADVETLTVHGRPVEQVIPFIRPKAQLLVLTQGAGTPAEIATILKERGYGASRLTVLAALGGPSETRMDVVAHDWSGDAPDFHTLAVECVAGEDAIVAGAAGLPDDAFVHDGKITKREVRALTLARLMPMRGALLWDIGAGSGAVGIEWIRVARDAEAIAVEPVEARRAMAATNAARLGAPRLKLVEGRAPDCLQDLPDPDAVFIGGGLSPALVDEVCHRLKSHGRIVANAVTLESEAILAALHQRLGGDLVRLSVARADAVGRYRGWRPHMPVTQWVYQA